MFFSSRVSTPPENAWSSGLASPRSEQGRLSQDSEEPDWLKSAAEELAPSPPPPITQRASEEEPEWLSTAATILETPPSAVDALAQATARAAAAERRAAEVEAENRRLRAEMGHKTPALTPASSTAASTQRSRRSSGSRAMDARIAAAREAGDEELLRSLLMEAARRCVEGASPSAGGGAAEASGCAAPDTMISPRGAPSPTPSSAGARRAHRFACPECGHSCTAVLPQKLTMVQCECGALFGVQRPARKKQAQRGATPSGAGTHEHDGATAHATAALSSHDSSLGKGCI